MAAKSTQKKPVQSAVDKVKPVNPVKPTSVAKSKTPDKQQKEYGNHLDRIIHERTRLAIVSALAANKVLTFNDLKGLLGVSDGNLSAHARKLEEADYLICNKGFEGRVPRTEYKLTQKGNAALQGYLLHMEALIKMMKTS